MQLTKIELKAMVASGKAQTVLDYLSCIDELKADKYLFNQIFHLKSQISSYNERITVGTISLEEANLLVNRINYATINLIDSIPEVIFTELNFKHQKERFEHEDWFELETWISSYKRRFVDRFNRDAEFRKNVLIGILMLIFIIIILAMDFLKFIGAMG